MTIFVTTTRNHTERVPEYYGRLRAAEKDFEWRNKLSFYYFFTTLFSGGLMPWYIMCVKYLHLKDSIWAMILPGIVSVWNILLVKGFMAGIPFEMTESAKIDGAGDFTIFLKLIWPLPSRILLPSAVYCTDLLE